MKFTILVLGVIATVTITILAALFTVTFQMARVCGVLRFSLLSRIA